MGNQLTVPSLSSWHIDDFNHLGLKNSTSIFDGTFILSFRAIQSNQSVAVKAIQVTNKYAQNVATTFANEYYKVFKALSPPGNYISSPYVSKNGAYLIRPFQDTSIPERLMSDPPLEPIDMLWITFQLLKSVKNLHDAGAYHGDIKPENFLIGSNLQVTLTDHAPFKPQVIGPNQPHFFIHFFSYGRRGAYLAPERISNELSSHPDMCAADLFSVGCVIAYLYTNGESLFDFTSLIQYSNNPTSPKFLDSIKNQDIRSLVSQLIDINPQKRIDNFESLFKIFPPWFENYYSQINKYPKSIITKNFDKIFPPDIKNDLIIYLTYFSSLLNSSIPISTFSMMIRNYTSCVSRMTDIRLKITRILPYLINLLKRGSAIVTGMALDSIIEIVKTIETIENEDEIVKYFCGVYFLPQLAQFMKIPNNQQSIIARIPIILVEFSRLWPSILEELPLRSAFLEPLMPIHFGQKKTNENTIIIVQSFLLAAKKVSYTKSYQIFKVICLMVFQILCPLYIPKIIDFLLTYLRVLEHSDKLKFYSEFYNLFQIPFIQYQPDESDPESMSVVLNSFSTMINDGCIPTYHYSSIASLAFKHLSSRNSSVRASAKILIKNLPPIYSQLEIFASARPKIFSDQNRSSSFKRSQSSTISFQQRSKSCDFPYSSISHTERVIPSPALLSSTKIAAGKIHKIFLKQYQNMPLNCIIYHSNGNINQYYIEYNKNRNKHSKHQSDVGSSEAGFSYKNIHKGPFHETVKMSINQEIVNVEVVDGRNELFITLRNKIFMQAREISTVLYDSKTKPLTACTIVGPETMASADKNALTCNDFSNDFKIEGTYKFDQAQSIKEIYSWNKMNYDLFAVSTINNQLAFFDRRSAVPIITTNFPQNLTKAVFLQDFQYTVALNDSVVNLFDLRRPIDSKLLLGSFKQRPIFQLNGRVDSLLPLDNSFIVLNQFGTFALMNGINGYSLFDQNKFVPMKPRNGFIESPILSSDVNATKKKRLTIAPKSSPSKLNPLYHTTTSLLATDSPLMRSESAVNSEQNNMRIPVIDLPNEKSYSVHHHLFPITASTSCNNGQICISGDCAGFVNVWSVNWSYT